MNLNSGDGRSSGGAVFAFETVAIRSVLIRIMKHVSVALRLFAEVHRHFVTSDVCFNSSVITYYHWQQRQLKPIKQKVHTCIDIRTTKLSTPAGVLTIIMK